MYYVKVIGENQVRKFYFLKARNASRYAVEMVGLGLAVDMQPIKPIKKWRQWRNK